jgi:hypothetical protein
MVVETPFVFSMVWLRDVNMICAPLVSSNTELTTA